MIISASRRTDIPAFYSEWLVNRFREGYALVPNPRFPRRYSRIELNRDTADLLVLWTKNPIPMAGRLEELDRMGIPFYFQFTLTPYGREVERFLPDKDLLLDHFQAMSRKWGSQRMVWRYDPIFFSGEWTAERHLKAFDQMSARLEGATDQCNISFMDFYPSIAKRINCFAPRQPELGELLELGEAFVRLGSQRGITVAACCETVELAAVGVEPAACIDISRVERVLGVPVSGKKELNQRPGCRCVESVELGVYHSCKNGCLYCYACNGSADQLASWERHNPQSPVMIGEVPEGAEIIEKKMKSCRVGQTSFF